MSLPGYVEYKRREYCKDIRCPIQLLLEGQESNSSAHGEIRDICINHCIHTTYEFHHWLIEKGYLVVMPEA
jgi:hypothetical protein